MRLDAITLEHFRNYAHQSVTFDPSVNVIVGENAQGKTNLLEAAVYLSCAKSPRARTEKEMISFEADAARLTGSVFSRGRDFTVGDRAVPRQAPENERQSGPLQARG